MRHDQPLNDLARLAANVIAGADALLIGAGAGMGVDSGLPDFRGPEGFWKAYPPYAKLGLGFTDLADPRWFVEDPSLAWGFYGHRMSLYRTTRPHEGFATLLRWAGRMPLGTFVYTSNVDGQFQKAGFDPARVVEAHGSIHALQCLADCGAGVFPADPYEVKVDPKTMRATGPLPACPRCEGMARPNILMFGDCAWDHSPSEGQGARLRRWLGTLDGCRLAVVECGAGTAIPTVRRTCESFADRLGGTLVRINPREPDVSPGHIPLPHGALESLRAIEEVM
jgi:NAD-dependent SIR2 family protein deacetylase